MRYMALDLGTKSCGVAYTDRTNTIAVPYKTIKFKHEDYDYLFLELKKVIDSENITHIVIGKPLNMDGSSGFAAKRSEYLATKLKELNLNISFVDERLTSVFASNILLDNNINAKKGKKIIDTVAACLILETFLKKVNYEQHNS